MQKYFTSLLHYYLVCFLNLTQKSEFITECLDPPRFAFLHIKKAKPKHIKETKTTVKLLHIYSHILAFCGYFTKIEIT